MSWIEGIGDEVTIGASVALGVCILFIAWLSTGIREIPFIGVIVVQLRRRRQLQAENDSSPSGAEHSVSSVNQPGENADGIDEREATPSGSETVIETASGAQNQENSAEAEELLSSKTETSRTSTENTAELSEKERNTSDLGQTSIPEKAASDNTHENDGHESTKDSNGSNVDTNGSEPAICPVSETELRQRRVDFFTSQNSGSTSSDNQSVNQSDDREINYVRLTQSSTSPKPNTLSELASNLLSSTTGTGTDSVNSNTDAGEQNQQTENQSETGSGSQDSGLEPGLIRVRIKFLNDTQRLVTSLATETIGNFRRIHFSTELGQSKLVRFIFNGRDLRNDSSTLQSYNICDNSVLHCLVTQQPQQQHQDHHGDEEGLDIGMFMFPLFGLLLGIVWYMRFMYRQFFNVTSTLTLAGITFLYLAAFMSSLRGQRNTEHID